MLEFISWLTVQDDSNQRLVVLVEDLPEGKGLLRRVGQQSEQQGDGVVRRKALRMDEPVSEIETSDPGKYCEALLVMIFPGLNSWIVGSRQKNNVIQKVQVQTWTYLVGCASSASLCKWKQGKVLKVPGTMETPETLLYRFSTSPNSSIIRKPNDTEEFNLTSFKIRAQTTEWFIGVWTKKKWESH